MGLGPGVQLCLIADCKPQTQEPSRHKNRIYRNIAPDASPNYGKSSKDHMCPVQDIVLSPPSSSLQEHGRLTVDGEHCAGETEAGSPQASPPNCGDTLPAAPYTLCTLLCALPFTANVSLCYSAPSHLQEESLSFWLALCGALGRQETRASQSPPHGAQSPSPEAPE